MSHSELNGLEPTVAAEAETKEIYTVLCRSNF